MATRARNEGSIYRQQTDGRWVAAISVGYRNGRRRRKKCFGATRGAVAAQLTHALHDHQHGLPVAPDRQTVGTLLTRWLEDSVKPSVRPTTYRSYQQLVDLHLTPGLGRYPLAKLTPPHQVQTFLNDQRRGGRILTSYQDQESPRTRTPRTVQYIHAVLRRALNQAMRWGLVSRNVATLVTPPLVTRQEGTRAAGRPQARGRCSSRRMGCCRAWQSRLRPSPRWPPRGSGRRRSPRSPGRSHHRRPRCRVARRGTSHDRLARGALALGRLRASPRPPASRSSARRFTGRGPSRLARATGPCGPTYR